MRMLLFAILASTILVSIGSLIESVVARQRADAIVNGLQHLDSSLDVLESRVNSIHSSVSMQQELAFSVMDSGEALKDAIERMENNLNPRISEDGPTFLAGEE